MGAGTVVFMSEKLARRQSYSQLTEDASSRCIQHGRKLRPAVNLVRLPSENPRSAARQSCRPYTVPRSFYTPNSRRGHRFDFSQSADWLRRLGNVLMVMCFIQPRAQNNHMVRTEIWGSPPIFLPRYGKGRVDPTMNIVHFTAGAPRRSMARTNGLFVDRLLSIKATGFSLPFVSQAFRISERKLKELSVGGALDPENGRLSRYQYDVGYLESASQSKLSQGRMRN